MRGRFAGLSWLIVLWTLLGTPASLADPIVFHATTSGQRAMDSDAKGGNPFASALIDSLARPSLTLNELAASLERLTLDYSKGKQRPDIPARASGAESLLPAVSGETRIALVLVVSDYGKAGANSLPGARFDAGRIATALTAAGFVTETAIDLDREAMLGTLDGFATRSRSADLALVYTTGHGVEVDGKVYLVPGDYPLSEGNAALERHAFPIARIAAAAHARRLNLIFYGGCRDNPLGE